MIEYVQLLLLLLRTLQDRYLIVSQKRIMRVNDLVIYIYIYTYIYIFIYLFYIIYVYYTHYKS